MNKKKSTCLFIAFLLVLILVLSFIAIFVEPHAEEEKDIINLNSDVTINNKKLNIEYVDKKVLDANITYGNIFTKVINITNNNNDDITIAIKYADSFISNKDVIYDLFISYDGTDYVQAVKSKHLIDDSYLMYNLVAPKNSTMNIKIQFKSMHENEETIIKGNIVITDNISSKDLFKLSINNLKEALEDKVDKLNGIVNKGYYYLNINDLSFTNEAKIKGYILVDADDISDIKYIYTIYNEGYMSVNNEYSSLSIVNVDKGYTDSLNSSKVCNQYDTRIKCSDFRNLPKNNTNKRRVFFNNSKKIINAIMNEKSVSDDKTYVYDITKDIANDTGLVGYVLVNKDNMFVYIHDDLFMISGYNYIRLGDYNIDSKTIRAYNESAFKLSALDNKTVCNFSGYQECYDINNNRIGSGY